jgi:hypothetical protein
VLKKCVLLTTVALIALCAAGCGVRKLTDSSFYGIKLTPSAESAKTVADLEVAPKKVLGRAKMIKDMPPYKPGDRLRDLELEREALLQALKADDPSGIGADVLVGAQFHYVRMGNELTVTVIGYPARYKNFRPESGSGFSVKNVRGASIIGHDSSSVTLEEPGNNLNDNDTAEPSVFATPDATHSATQETHPSAPANPAHNTYRDEYMKWMRQDTQSTPSTHSEEK